MSGCDHARSVLKRYLCPAMLEKVPRSPFVAKHYGFSVRVAGPGCWTGSSWGVYVNTARSPYGPMPCFFTANRRAAMSVARALRFLGCRYEE